MLVALGLKKTLEHVGDPLSVEISTALLGGAAIYLLAHVAFRWRNVHSLSRRRLLLAVVCLALVPAGTELPSLATEAILAALLVALIAYEAIRYAEARDRVRHELAHGAPAG